MKAPRPLALLSFAAALAPALASGAALAQAPCPGIQRESVSQAGVEAQGESLVPVISGDGRFSAFLSSANNLVAGDTSSQFIADIFRRDRATGELTLITHAPNASGGGPADDTASFHFSISQDGRYIAYDSFASNMSDVLDTNQHLDVFRYDALTDTSEMVNVTPSGTQPSNFYSGRPQISANGRFVGFASASTDILPNDVNAARDAFVRDMDTGVTFRVSESSAGVAGNAENNAPSLSADGMVVSFQSFSNNLVPNDTNARPDIFVHFRATGETRRVSVSSSGTQANHRSDGNRITPDGRYVFFVSNASNLVPVDTNGAVEDVFRHDLETGETILVNRSSSGEQGNGRAFQPRPSADGRYVLFSGESDNLVPGDTNGLRDAFVRDLLLGTTIRVDVSDDGVQADITNPGTGGGHVGGLSDDASVAVFGSWATVLVPADGNDLQDAFARQLFLVPERHCLGVPNSTGAGARMDFGGNTSLDANRFTLLATSTPNTTGLFFFGPNRIQAPFGDGMRCVGGTVRRLAPRSAAGNLLRHDVDFSAGNAAAIASGGVLSFQAWFRDPAAGGAGFNLSDALEFQFCD